MMGRQTRSSSIHAYFGLEFLGGLIMTVREAINGQSFLASLILLPGVVFTVCCVLACYIIFLPSPSPPIHVLCSWNTDCGFYFCLCFWHYFSDMSVSTDPTDQDSTVHEVQSQTLLLLSKFCLWDISGIIQFYDAELYLSFTRMSYCHYNLNLYFFLTLKWHDSKVREHDTGFSQIQREFHVCT